jgi:hypothetical protein
VPTTVPTRLEVDRGKFLLGRQHERCVVFGVIAHAPTSTTKEGSKFGFSSQ